MFLRGISFLNPMPMRKPVLLFVLKCVFVIYFFASPSVTVFTPTSNTAEKNNKNKLKVNSNPYTSANVILKDEAFTFNPLGKLKATKSSVTSEGFRIAVPKVK
jgi:hypothetical protein